MRDIKSIIAEKQGLKIQKNLSTEFQVYGVYLAETLEDTKHYSLYIKLAKTTPRPLLEEALAYVKGYASAKSKGRLFMWRLKQLKIESKT